MVIMMIPAIFRDLCPDNQDLETHNRMICLERDIKEIEDELDSYVKFFQACLGSPPWEIQRTWAKRALAKKSFAAIAPTGVGKTAFGIVTSYYFSLKGWGKSYLIFPTSLLVDQALERFKLYKERLGQPLSILYYKSNMSLKQRREFLERLSSRDFDVLITTSQYLAKNSDLIRKSVGKFSFLFVDDVDSLLKNSRNVDRVLLLMGFNEGDIKKVLSGNDLDKKTDSILIVSTATGRPGKRASLFRKMLGFNVGVLRHELLRNITDIYTRDKKSLRTFIEKMGSGFLIFVPKLERGDEIRDLVESLGYKAEIMHGYNESLIQKFKEGEIDSLIGAARPYGVLVRGIDLPRRIRYTIFYGVPRFEITVGDLDGMSERALITIFSTLAKGLDPESKKLAIRLRRRGIRSKKDLEMIKSILNKVFSNKEILKGLSSVSDITVNLEEGKVIIPDIRTYIQGSGRSSRLYPGGLTKGASLVLEEKSLLLSFLKRASAYDLEFSPIEEVDLKGLKDEIDESRRKYSSLASYESAGLLKTALFIVESPNKARTIARFFGRPSIRQIGESIAYEVTTGEYVLTIMASGGHIVDLSTSDGYHGVLIKKDGSRVYIPIYSSIKRCLDCGYQFTDGNRCPKCGSTNIRDSKSNVSSMRELSSEVSRVIIGTDPDTEGEKISWDIYQLIRDAANEIYRAEFHEVTKRAILNALENLGEINESRVKAQIVRRIEDRWIGFELSREVQERFKRKNLSAGRAQTPTLGWIIDRYREHKKKKDITVIRGDGIFLKIEGKISSPGRFKAKIIPLGLKKEVVKPIPPFTTDEMLREASRIIHLGAKRTMEIAQSLFEAGLITYHRTDSIRVSDAGFRVAAEILGDEFIPRRWGEGGAHECIRPTKPLNARDLLDYIREGLIALPEKFSKDHIKLYDLIFRRFIASQSKESVLTRQIYKLVIDGWETEDSRIIESGGGWVSYYPFIYQPKPPLKEGTMEIEVKHFQVPSVPLYTQGDIVALMREKGIGRPSTYATIIDKLLQRKYVIEKSNKLIPTKLGTQVYGFLTAEYPDLVSEERTKMLEEKMTSVEEGRSDYQMLLDELYSEIWRKIVEKRKSK